MVDDSHVVFQTNNSAWMHMFVIGLSDTECICVERTLIVLRNNLYISVIREVRTHIGRILILLRQQIQYGEFMIY